MSIDYRTLLDDASHFPSGDKYIGGQILATRIPDLCPDCKGSGEVERDTGAFGTVDLHTCDHPYAPTIADLLRWGENVAKADQLGYGDVGVVGYGVTDSAAVLLAALRTEAEQSGADR